MSLGGAEFGDWNAFFFKTVDYCGILFLTDFLNSNFVMEIFKIIVHNGQFDEFFL